MTDSTVGPCSLKDEPPAGWAVLFELLGGWGITLRLVLFIGVPIAAVVAIVALVVIYLGAVGVGALLTLGGGYGQVVPRTPSAAPIEEQDLNISGPATTSAAAAPPLRRAVYAPTEP